MGSDPIALPALNSIKDGDCGDIEIVAVYTQPDRPRGRGKKVLPNEIKTWALENNLEARQPERMRKTQRLEIEADQSDVILVMAYGHILSQKLIDTPRYGIWNLHTSLLPRYRGASPIQCAIANGDQETGVSLMQMVREMDAGPVLDVEKTHIECMDTALEVEHRLAQACRPLLRRNLPAILRGEASAIPQENECATYVRKLGKQDGVLDFKMPAKQIAHRINGLFPWPGTSFPFEGLSIKVGLADFDGLESGLPPGQVVTVDFQSLVIACGEGRLHLKRLQRPGGKMLPAKEFLRGFEIPVGKQLESRPMTELVSRRPHGG